MRTVGRGRTAHGRAEATCGIPVEMLTAVPVIAGALAEEIPDVAVMVSPDLGAVKSAEHYAGLLRRPAALVRKPVYRGPACRPRNLSAMWSAGPQ